MSGNVIENFFTNVLGERLAEKGIGFIYAHNRGYSHINDIATKPINKKDNGWNFKRVGVVYELFEDSLKDITAWVAKARELGYSKIILLGHSLGSNKTIYYLYKNPSEDIAGVILASPPDLVGSAQVKYSENHKKLLLQAQAFVAQGQPRELLDGQLWNWYKLSAQTYLSLFQEGGAAHNLPYATKPEKFEQLASLTQPILIVAGEYDDIKINNLKEEMELIKTKAISSSDVQIEFIEGGNHNYENRENAFAETILKWVENKYA